MLNFKKYIVLFMLLSVVLLQALPNDIKKHIEDRHIFNKDQKYSDQIRNKLNGVISAINEKGDRKTFFPINFNEDTIFELIDKCDKSACLCSNQTNDKARVVQYKQEGVGTITYVKSFQADKIITAYPILRYISKEELSSKASTDKVYLATIKNNKNELKDIECTVEQINKFTKNGYKMGGNDKKGIYLLDISSKIFGPSLAFNSHILVEIDKKN